MKSKQQKQQKGFTLIELMIVVAIIGILATYAIPAYNAYMVKSRIAGVLNSVQGIKAGMASDMVEFGTEDSTAAAFPQTYQAVYGGAAGGDAAGTEVGDLEANDALIDDIQIANDTGAISIVLANDTRLGNAAGETLTLTPTLRVGGSVAWTCDSTLAATDRDLLPGSCR